MQQILVSNFPSRISVYGDNWLTLTALAAPIATNPGHPGHMAKLDVNLNADARGNGIK